MNPLETVRIGKTKLKVTRLGFGCAPLGGLFHDMAETEASATVRHALDLGLNFLDTAPLYGHSKSELRLGRALSDRDKKSLVIATKVGRLLVPELKQKVESIWFENLPPLKPVFDFSYDGVMRSWEESVRRLNLERIDILHIHDPEDHYDEAMKGAYPALARLRSERAISAISVGTNHAEPLVRFAHDGDFDCFLLANRYTLLDQTGLRELLPLCAQKQISVIIGAPYNSGILAMGAQPGAKFEYMNASPEILKKVGAIEKICARYGVPLKAAALQFPLAHPAVASVIPGARSVAEVEENFRMVGLPVPRDFWNELMRSGILPEEGPLPAGTEL